MNQLTPAIGAMPRPSVIYRRAGPALAPGGERYVLKGGGTLTLAVFAGDAVTLTDIEGLQAVELAAAGADGRFDAGILGVSGAAPARALRELLSSHAVKALAERGIALAGATAIRLFGRGARAGETVRFTVTRDGTLIAAAPAEQPPATDIEVRVMRADPKAAEAAIRLPDPLANPAQDIPIPAASARAYLVKAGEYIQILDVRGRQMTDFQCFSARKLDKGLENALDATVTRTLTGRAYPTPGLPSKAFGFDFEPLVEVIQDTCGRHDAFATACNPRYYDDAGYPGHVNCTDNFNAALQPFGIAKRRGWEALNFFYNTRIDALNQIQFDESWSRPGDYVLLKALTDVVCVSSACPDDISCGNGWNPTEMHVRTYSSLERFPKAVALRMTPDADPKLTEETAFHPKFSALTRNYTEYRGFWLPTRFNNANAIEEYWACREACVVMDLSPLRKFEVTGPDAEALLQYCLTRDIRKLSVGQVVYTAMCYPHGGMIDDGTVFRLGQNNFRWIGGDDYSGLWLREQAEAMGFQAWARSSTREMHNIAVQGPNARALMKEIVWTAPAQTAIGELEWFRFCIGRIGDFEGAPIVVSRTGYTGELGYEIFCHPKDAAAVFDAVWAAGEKHGLKPMGLEALDMVRIEAGLIFAHTEFSDQTDPFEAGIGFTVPLKSKTDDFIGKAALIERKAHPRHKLVGLEIGANDAVTHGDCVHIGRAQIGTVTSATRSPLLKTTIALARVDVTHAALGTAVEVGKLDGHMKRLPARVVRFPHFDPEKTRPRS